MIFSIAMGAEYLSYVKSIATFAPTFYGYIISVLASVVCHLMAESPPNQAVTTNKISVISHTNSYLNCYVTFHML